jgi:hypothetical protein
VIGYIEWTSKKTQQVERANVTRCITNGGVYHLEFSNSELCSEGGISLGYGTEKQQTTGTYMFTDRLYRGEANVVGNITSSKDLISFEGAWHDLKDETGAWDVYIEFERPHMITLTTPEH